ncbi:RING finger protein [Spongorhabdus nitratireducens]
MFFLSPLYRILLLVVLICLPGLSLAMKGGQSGSTDTTPGSPSQDRSSSEASTVDEVEKDAATKKKPEVKRNKLAENNWAAVKMVSQQSFTKARTDITTEDQEKKPGSLLSSTEKLKGYEFESDYVLTLVLGGGERTAKLSVHVVGANQKEVSDFQRMICPLCEGVLRTPVMQMSCGERACRQCVLQYQKQVIHSRDTQIVEMDGPGSYGQSENDVEKDGPPTSFQSTYNPSESSSASGRIGVEHLVCPKCKTNVHEANKDKAAERELAADRAVGIQCPLCQQFYCHAFELRSEHGQMVSHMRDDCPCLPIPCPNRERGCEFECERRCQDEMQAHIKECEYQLEACEFCQTQALIKMMKEHHDECDQYPVKIVMSSDLQLTRLQIKCLIGAQKSKVDDLGSLLGLAADHMLKLQQMVLKQTADSQAIAEERTQLQLEVKKLQARIDTDIPRMERLLQTAGAGQVAFDLQVLNMETSPIRYYQGCEPDQSQALLVNGMSLTPCYSTHQEYAHQSDYYSRAQTQPVIMFQFGVLHYRPFQSCQVLGQVNVLIFNPRDPTKYEPCGSVKFEPSSESYVPVKKHMITKRYTFASIRSYADQRGRVKVILEAR